MQQPNADDVLAELEYWLKHTEDRIYGRLNGNSLDAMRDTVRNVCTIQGSRASQLLARAIRNQYVEVQKLAAEELSKRCDRSVLTLLIEALTDSDSFARVLACRVVGKLGDPKAINSLVPLLRDESTDVRSAAASALTILGWNPSNSVQVATREIAVGNHRKATVVGMNSFDALVEDLQHKQWMTRRAAAEALGELHNVKAFAPLVVALADEDPSVCVAAGNALRYWIEDAAIDELTHLLTGYSWDADERAKKRGADFRNAVSQISQDTFPGGGICITKCSNCWTTARIQIREMARERTCTNCKRTFYADPSKGW